MREVVEVLRRVAPRARIAIVGASRDRNKFGNKILRDLAAKGYPVQPVNPRGGTIEGFPVARSLAEVERPVDIVVMVVPPEVTREVLEDAAAGRFPAVWLQDGSFDDAVLAYAATAPFRTVYGACVMVESEAGPRA